MRRKLLVIAATALSVGGAAAQTTLVLSSFAGPSHPMNAEVLPAWGLCLDEKSGGSLKIDLRLQAASPQKQLELVESGGADVAWVFHGYHPDRFMLTRMVEFPGGTASAQVRSVAYWQVYTGLRPRQDEHEGLHLLALMVNGPAVMHGRAPVRTLEAFKGARVRVASGVAGEVGELLGVVPVKVAAPEDVRKAMDSGAADGVFMPIEGQAVFGLKDIAPVVTQVEGGFYFSSWAIAMNKLRYNRLAPHERAAVDGCSGELLSRQSGAMWDRSTSRGQAVTAHQHDGGAEMASLLASRVQPLIQSWIAQAEARGVDGSRALASYLGKSR